MESETEYDRNKREYIQVLDFCLATLDDLNVEWDEVSAYLAEKYPEKAALLKQSAS